MSHLCRLEMHSALMTGDDSAISRTSRRANLHVRRGEYTICALGSPGHPEDSCRHIKSA